MVRKVIVKEATRVDTNLKVKKVSTKSELGKQLKNLLKINDTLEETNKKNMTVILSFETKIQCLEGQIQSLGTYIEVISQQTQTETDLNLKCDECNFEGANEKELGWHMGKYHGWPGDEKTDDMDIRCESQGVRYCMICDYEAEDMYDLEAHHWSEHEDVEVVDHDRRSLE